jgi:tetratricopeptide (TPR) repeat protein
MSAPLPLGLRQALESGQCVLFVGAGVGGHLHAADGTSAPDAVALASEMAHHFSIDPGSTPDLAKVAQLVQIRKGRPELETFLRKRLADLEPDETLRWLFSLRWRAIFTTNYDSGIQRSYALNPNPVQNPVTISKTADLTQFETRIQVPIFHLHGNLFGPSNGQIVISEDDYIQFREQRRMMFELLKVQFATSTILYVGYSNRDPNWKLVLEEIRGEFLPSPMPPAYRVSPDTNQIDVELLSARGVETIDLTLEGFRETATLALSTVTVPADVLQKLGPSIPSDLANAFETNPAAVARLLASWEYANQAPFDAVANLKSFLRGDRANWALIARGMQFTRDLEEGIYDEMLDFATARSTSPSTLLLLGPAGYGISTLLLTLAAKLVYERAGPVFVHKPGTQLVQGDIEFAMSIFPGIRPFFVIDNAADDVATIDEVIHQIKRSQRAGLFLLGERLNEWRQRRGKTTGREFLLEPLSDPEINRLLDCLGKHGELNKLQHLSRDLQFTAIKEKHGKELLVAMREATEDKGFDAILEDEYRGIADDFSRRLYLIVCCFYQHGAFLRDSLLAQLLEVSLTTMYSKSKDATEGVVVYELVDEISGRYTVRARHRTIADVVWRRCGEAGDRERIIQSALFGLNLNYKSDRSAFDQFVSSDHVVDAIRTLDGKIQFFETACRKDPDSPYVRQHFARMLARQNKLELALNQIEAGIKMAPTLRVLHHTQGVILTKLALAIDSPELARRRLVQAEESFRRCLSFYSRDEYAYQGLAQLYLSWAMRVKDGAESTEYIARSEGVISEGLRVVRVRDGLWIVSANVEDWIGDQPSRLHALEQAVKTTPGSILARYLLGRAYRRAGSPQKAASVLEPLIKDHPDEFRACVEYARALLSLGQPYANAIAVLRLSTTYGLTDPRFIAMLGGVLFLNGDFTEAANVFHESVKQELPPDEANRVQFRPRDPSDPQFRLRLQGEVVKVTLSHALIQTSEYPAIQCPGSMWGGISMRVGQAIRFEPVFSARGPMADKPRLI